MVGDSEMLEQVQRIFTRSFGPLKHMGYEQRMKALGLRSLERPREIGDFKIIRGLDEIRGHCGSLPQINWNGTLRGNVKLMVRVHVTVGLRSE